MWETLPLQGVGGRDHAGPITFLISMKKLTDDSMFYGAEPIIFEYAKALRKVPTRAERVLWKHLNKNKLGVKFRRQHPVSRYIADFYCHRLKLVIEIDGDYHLDSVQGEYDKFRTEDLREFGIKVIRFTNNQVLSNIESVLNQIKNEIFLLK